jgi:pimeloyl-ACP methyl ester carboxylesterase
MRPAFGHSLPSTTINRAPSVAAPSRQADSRTYSPLLLLRSGSERPPLLIIHGLDGNTARFSILAERIQTEHPIYGIQAKGIDGAEEPLDRVEEMGDSYLAAIEKIEPHGPYLLSGYSFGGLVAFEIARRLLEDGKDVALLALLDAFPAPRYLPVIPLLELIAQRPKFHISEMGRLPFSKG